MAMIYVTKNFLAPTYYLYLFCPPSLLGLGYLPIAPVTRFVFYWVIGYRLKNRVGGKLSPTGINYRT